MKVYLRLFLFGVFILAGCTRDFVQRRITYSSAVQALVPIGENPMMKAHLKDGQVFVLKRWAFHDSTRTVSGTGVLYDINRDSVGGGDVEFPYSDVALYESNIVGSRNGPATGLMFLTGASVAMSIYCLSNPKACFGSCPTFYAWDGHGMALQAEGFSSSIAPALERTDLDAMCTAVAGSRNFVVQVKNEAIETHVIRSVRLIAVPRRPGMRIFKTEEGEFLEGETLALPMTATSCAGDVSNALRNLDGVEYFSTADSADLARRENVDLSFEGVPAGSLGLVVTSRQTLMTTYILYQGLAYMGNSAAHWLAELERNGESARTMAGGCGDALGFIDVEVEKGADHWVPAGTVGETGPLARDVSVIPLPDFHSKSGKLHLRLHMTRGFWRIDQAVLVRLGGSVDPVRLNPQSVVSMGNDEYAAGAPWDISARPLTLLPGDVYTLTYRLPENPSAYELFMESTGYYLEWMRAEWLPEEDPKMVAQLLNDPAEFLRTIAPGFKRVEPDMERSFWNSRYERRP